MKLFKGFVAALLVDQTDAIRRGYRRQRQQRGYNSFELRDIPMGDDPYVDMPVLDRGPRPTVLERDELQSGDPECEPEQPICGQPDECTAVMQKEEGCTCDCNEEEPPKCNLDVIIMIDVCSCGWDVWQGVVSYVDALSKKFEAEIGINADDARISIVQYSKTTETIIPFTDSITAIKAAVDNMSPENFVAEGTYVTNGLDQAISEFNNARPNARKVLVTIADGYNHPNVKPRDVQEKIRQLGSDIELHAVTRGEPFKTEDECNDSQFQRKVEQCKNRAQIMTMLNDQDQNIYEFSDARSLHDVIDSCKSMCEAPAQKKLHCNCICPLPDGCPGAPGINGVPGERGGPGGAGEVGADGVPGIDGPQGDKGPNGEPGADGTPGVNGPDGEPGTFGGHGAHGQRGGPGLEGPKGIKGPMGPSGDTGDNGDSGAKGGPGVKGMEGMPGNPGPVGAVKQVDMGDLRNAVFAILDELKPGGESADDKLRAMNIF